MPFEVDAIQKQELLTTFACLALHDDGADLTEDGVKAMIAAAGAQVEPYWPKLFVNMLKGRDVAELLLNAGAGGPAAGGAAAPGAAAPAAAAKEEEPEEEEEEEEEDEGFSLFD
ncbi:60S acidic ribosomal protein P1 [Plasmodiophora brassicae]|uniref:60S acidic ribosomal protein P1 n=1 Tax=Plasmodiophora brassicae TaxID=37360 RepID=A0A0G4IGJ5_PLABS|nr:hypothetical protein PBRA_000010 [Plasmodiophora brassicae]SPQ96589.1 unnamed protein product [Plasmodiophora brassicae]